jgi:putative spermidine/putrescine transport system ATP-binding protein
MAEVQVRKLTLFYGSMKALDEVTLDFPNGQFFGLLGPSGSGKTTLLRAIAGFLRQSSGEIRIGGEAVENVPVEKRQIGMMFQNYALFPNMSVTRNVAFGLEVRKLPRPEIDRRVGEALELVRLGAYGARRPQELSGGQRQRVALARAIVTRPRVLLLDEPLSALDKSLRVDMQIELRRIQREVGITTIFVTHDQEEALTLSDRIGILAEGRLVQVGAPREIYRGPANRFTASFLGEANFLNGVPEAAGLRLADGALAPWPSAMPKGARTIAIRPEAITLSRAKPDTAPQQVAIAGNLEQIVFSGPTATCLVRFGENRFKVLVKNQELAWLPSAGPVWLSWAADDAIVLSD